MFVFTETVRFPAPPSRRGFSLIELMIVVAIFGALVAIIIPSFGYSEQSAKNDVVIAEMHQIREAFARFYQDNYPSDDKLSAMASYGLWPLFTTNTPPNGLDSIVRIGYDDANRLGWRGPYALMEKSDQPVYLKNGQPKNTTEEGGGSGTPATIPVALDPYDGYYRVLHPDSDPDPVNLYLVCTGPDCTLQTKPSSTDAFGRLVAVGDDTVLPLRKP